MKITDLKTKGFVSIAYPSELRVAVERAESSWREFCELPVETKKVFSYSNSGAGVGYEIKDGSGPAGDIKENFDVAIGGLNWLRVQLQKYENPFVRDFVNDAIALVKVMTPFIVDFASQAEKTFGLKDFKKEIVGGSDAFFVRFIHYPPQKNQGEATAQAHPDQSGFTFHLFESAPGLECLTYDGKWIPMPVSEEETVIIPDMQMQLRSGGVLRALWHRVVATAETAIEGRYSAVSFIQFKDTPKYDKDKHGRLQEKPEGFNYNMSYEEFTLLFK